MINFHPTIRLSTYLKISWSNFNEKDLDNSLKNLFPEHITTLTDSGRSALALAIETLALKGKKVLIPAYLCKVLLPVLEKYEISPKFIDIDKQTFTPQESSYTEELLESIDAVLLVATYGNTPSKTLISKIKSLNKIVIEDYAHIPLNTDSGQKIEGHARYYSLPKMLPVTHGGILITKSPTREVSGNAKNNFKNWLKLFTIFQFLISKLSTMKQQNAQPEVWSGIKLPSKSVKKFLGAYLKKENDLLKVREKYCIPTLTKNPNEKRAGYFKQGISTYTIWNDPIIFYVNEDISKYPNTKYVSEHILCLPGSSDF